MTCTTSYRCTYHQQKRNAKFASYRRWNATERKFRWHDLESRSQVKHRSWQVQSWDFQGRCKFSKIWYPTHNFVTISRIVRVLFSENPRRGCISPVQTCLPLKPMTHIYLNYGYTPSPEIVKLTTWLRETSLSWSKRVIQKQAYFRCIRMEWWRHSSRLWTELVKKNARYDSPHPCVAFEHQMTIQSPLVYELCNLASSERHLHHCARVRVTDSTLDNLHQHTGKYKWGKIGTAEHASGYNPPSNVIYWRNTFL